MLQTTIKQAAAKVSAIRAPVAGWNRRDPLANMKKGFAVLMDNFFPTAGSVDIRRGNQVWTDDLLDAYPDGDPVTINTLIAYRPKSGQEELWAFGGEFLWDVSAAGSATASELGSLTDDQWACSNFATVGGNFLLCVNGADLMLLYDGTDWLAIDDMSTPAITGVATSDLINLFVHKARVFYIEEASMSAWYSAVGAFAGALTELDLSSEFSEGGFLLAGGSWSIDAGDGQDDYAVFITDQGELAVYQGTDPSSANTWAKVGTFKIGTPIGRRCTLKYGGDLLLLTVDGVISAASAFSRGREISKQLALSDNIQGEVAKQGELYKDTFGWQMTLFSTGSMLLVNVPEAGGVKQWVMNTVTKAWTRFKGWETSCFEIYNDNLYMGGAGVVRQAWIGKSDSGEPIEAEVVPAFEYFGTQASTKQWNMLQMIVEWDANPISVTIGFDSDFFLEDPMQEVALSTAEGGGAIWDTDEWDGAQWAGSVSPKRSEWYGVSAIGTAGAPHIKIRSDVSAARLISMNTVHMPGNVF
jgi:hypothetical protein